jgi:uncharacterized membrane protein
VPLIGAALVGFGVALYLTLYQLGHIDRVWDPIFGAESSGKVLHSALARALPVPDAALGACAYLVEAVGAVIGGQTRFRTLPWVVVSYGCAVALFGAVGLTLALVQAFVVHAFCTLCLLSAAISVGLVPPAMQELWASLEHSRRRGGNSTGASDTKEIEHHAS